MRYSMTVSTRRETTDFTRLGNKPKLYAAFVQYCRGMTTIIASSAVRGAQAVRLHARGRPFGWTNFVPGHRFGRLAVSRGSVFPRPI